MLLPLPTLGTLTLSLHSLCLPEMLLSFTRTLDTFGCSFQLTFLGGTSKSKQAGRRGGYSPLGENQLPGEDSTLVCLSVP